MRPSESQEYVIDKSQIATKEAQKINLLLYKVQDALVTVQSQRMNYTRRDMYYVVLNELAQPPAVWLIFMQRLTLNICSATRPSFYRL